MKINKIFDRVKGKKVIIVGDAMIDSYTLGKIERKSPEAPVAIINVEKEKIKLVGAANVRRAKIAADMVKQGKAVPAPVMVAYAPIVTMIDDIAKGGYTFVKLLQVIHARAKNKK